MNPSECKDLRQNPTLPMCRWLILLCSGLLQSSCTQAGCSIVGTVSGSTGPSSGAYTLKPHRRLLALKKNDKKGKSSFQHVYHGCCEAALFWCFFSFSALFSVPLAFISTGTNSFKVNERLAIMSSVCCAHGGDAGLGRVRTMAQTYPLETSLVFPVPALDREASLCKDVYQASQEVDR